jgi:hypothetical protein
MISATSPSQELDKRPSTKRPGILPLVRSQFSGRDTIRCEACLPRPGRADGSDGGGDQHGHHVQLIELPSKEPGKTECKTWFRNLAFLGLGHGERSRGRQSSRTNADELSPGHLCSLHRHEDLPWILNDQQTTLWNSTLNATPRGSLVNQLKRRLQNSWILPGTNYILPGRKGSLVKLPARHGCWDL